MRLAAAAVLAQGGGTTLALVELVKVESQCFGARALANAADALPSNRLGGSSQSSSCHSYAAAASFSSAASALCVLQGGDERVSERLLCADCRLCLICRPLACCCFVSLLGPTTLLVSRTVARPPPSAHTRTRRDKHGQTQRTRRTNKLARMVDLLTQESQ